MRQVGYLPELYKDARSEKYKQLNTSVTNLTFTITYKGPKMTPQRPAITTYCSSHTRQIYDR